MIFKARISKWIIFGYGLILLFIGGIFLLTPFLEKNMSSGEKNFLIGIFFFIGLIFIWILRRACTMKFKISQGKLTIKGVFKTHRISLSEIEKVNKSVMPFGIRLFGASGLGGYYYFPGLDKAWLNMGNFEDGVLIKTKSNKLYIVTPINPEKFVEEINKQK